MKDYTAIARSEFIRQQRIDELMDLLQREKARSNELMDLLQREKARSARYFTLIKEFARLALFDIDRLEVLISNAQDMVAEEIAHGTETSNH